MSRASGYDYAKDGYYVETAWAVEALLAKEPIDHRNTAWDPACGGGNIPSVLKRHGIDCFASDIVDRGYAGAGVIDFFKCEAGVAGAEVIISNPPFHLMEEFTRHAYALTTDRVILLARLAFLEGQGREKFFAEIPLARVFVSRKRISMPPGGTDVKPTGGSIAYAWFVFQHGYSGPWIGGWC